MQHTPLSKLIYKTQCCAATKAWAGTMGGDDLQNAGRWKVYTAQNTQELFSENFKTHISICAQEGVEGNIH